MERRRREKKPIFPTPPALSNDRAATIHMCCGGGVRTLEVVLDELVHGITTWRMDLRERTDRARLPTLPIAANRSRGYRCRSTDLANG